MSEFSLQVIIVVSQLGKLRSNLRRKQCLSLFLWSLSWNPIEKKFFLLRYFSFLRTVCYYLRTGWNHIILFMVTQRNEDAGWDQYCIFLFLMSINGGSGGMGGCVVRLQFLCLNPGLERFSSTISRFKCGLWGKTLIARNSQLQANMQGNLK